MGGAVRPRQPAGAGGHGEALEELRAAEDAVDAHLLAEAIASDPLMTLKLLAHLARLRRGRGGSDTETVTEALVMLGIPPFFRAFGPQTAAEDLLAASPSALAGFHEVLRRSHRAARFALGFAVHRMDHDAPVIHEAALLHDFAELLLWLRAPALALRDRAPPADRTRPALGHAQRECLHIELAELQQALMRGLAPAGDRWCTSPTEAPRRRRSRCATCGWRSASRGTARRAGTTRRCPTTWQTSATLLQLGPEPTLRLLRDIDAD